MTEAEIQSLALELAARLIRRDPPHVSVGSPETGYGDSETPKPTEE
ncbi:hypothetical protein [Streptomyces sp. NPDC014894]